MPKLTSRLELEDRVRWYTRMRWLYLLPLALAGIIPQLISGGYSDFVRDQLSIGIIAVVANFGFYLVGRRRGGSRGYYKILAASQIFFDIILATWLLLLNGGIESRTAVVYAIPIIMSGALFGSLGIYLTGFGSAFSYVFFVTLDHLGKIQPPNVNDFYLHTDTTYYWRSVFFYSGVLLVLSMIVDYVGRLARRKEQIEEEMHTVSAEKAKTEAILATMGNALVAVDLKGKITAINDSFEEVTGWQKDEVLGKAIDDTLPILDEKGEPIAPEQRPLHAILKASEPVHQSPQRVTDYYYRRKNGTTFPFTAYVAPIVLRNRVIGATTVFQDASTQQNMQQLRNNFVALASHQLKTPIVEIQGYLENMQSGVVGKLSDEQEEYVKRMYTIAERCAQLLTDLLDITVLEKGGSAVNNKPTSLSRIVKKVEKIYSGRMSWKGLELKINEKDGDLRVIADHNKLVESIGNVVANAIRFSKEGSIDINTHKEANQAVISITDHGTGVDRDAIVALFSKDEVLAAAPTAEGGTGLGLYLAKQLVILQGGSISLTETSSKGTTIAIRIQLEGAK